MNDTEPIQDAGDPTPHDQHVAPTPPPAPPAPEPAPTVSPATSSGPGFRDRVLGLRAVAGVALAGLVLGGLGGAALGAISDGGGSRDGGPGGGFGRPGLTQQNGQLGQPGGGTGPQGVPGPPPAGAPGVPPGTTQQDDVQPDGGDDTSSGSHT